MKRAKSKREKENEELIEQIRRVQEEVKWRYGSPRVSEALRQKGYRAGENRIARLMRRNGLGRRIRKRFRSTTDSRHSLKIAENLLRRRFTVPRENHSWVSDITYIATAEGWLYLCVVIDLYSRKVVGWAMSNRIDGNLVIRALQMALVRRMPPQGLIFHSDRGSQYCSDAFRKVLKDKQIRQSMSRKCDCWDSAPSESFFKTLKSELTGYRAFPSRLDVRKALFEYIEVFYNRIRLHSAIEYQSPEEFERLHCRVAA